MSEKSVIEINLSVVSDNLKLLKSYCDPRVKQMAVVKANAYGHGAVEVARAVCGQVDWFAVNGITEAVALRENGILNSILVFGVPMQAEAALYKKHNITATISSSDHFDVLPAGTDYHLNFDSGMGRLGFDPEQAEPVKELIKNHPHIHCKGIYSHFATADEPGSPKAEEQLKTFKDLRSRFDSKLLTHMCNTAGTVQYPDAHFDLVRNGIGMYGYAPGMVSLKNVKPALTWKTRLIQVNQIRKSETVSYGAVWKAPQDGYIGVIPAGYADGIPRNLSGKFSVMVDGKARPVVGTVTMNYCMIWLGKKKLKPGTEVELLGSKLNARHWADAAGTIPYEILTRLPTHLSRKYL